MDCLLDLKKFYFFCHSPFSGPEVGWFWTRSLYLYRQYTVMSADRQRVWVVCLTVMRLGDAKSKLSWDWSEVINAFFWRAHSIRFQSKFHVFDVFSHRQNEHVSREKEWKNERDGEKTSIFLESIITSKVFIMSFWFKRYFIPSSP